MNWWWMAAMEASLSLTTSQRPLRNATIQKQQSTVGNNQPLPTNQQQQSVAKKWKQSVGSKKNCNSNQQLSNNQPAVTKRRTIMAQ